MQLTIHLPNMAKGAEVFNALGIFNNGETYEIDDTAVMASGWLGFDEDGNPNPVPASIVVGDTSVELVTVADEEPAAPVPPDAPVGTVTEPAPAVTDGGGE
jgi:hypothetical protein